MGTNSVTVVQGEVNVKELLTALTFASAAKVGYPEETTGPVIHEESNITLASLAAVHEQGDANVPPRPFMRQGAGIFEQRRGLLTVQVKRLAEGRMDGRSFMSAVGLLMKSSIEAAVLRQDFVPLAEITLKHKKTDQILVESGELTKNIDVYIGSAI